jgi:Tol biopolymer transport system component
MKYLVILFILSFFYACGEDTINNNGGNPIADFDVYLYKQKDNPLKYSTYTIKMDGTGYNLFNDSLIVSTSSKQNRIMLVKIDTNMLAISDIYYAETNGVNIVKIPTGNYRIDYFDLSPDAEKFLFTSGYDATLSIMNLDGSGYVLLSDRIMTDAFIPKFSPNGDLIAYLETQLGSTKGVYITNTSGTYKKLLKDSIYTTSEFTLDWSPDGSKIVYQNRIGSSNESKICIIDTSGSGYNVITTGFSPAWSPAGGKICYVVNVNPGNFDLFIMNPDGTGITNFTNTSTIYEHNQKWSADGTKILYSSTGLFSSQYYSIYDMNTNSSRILADSVNGAIWK